MSTIGPIAPPRTLRRARPVILSVIGLIFAAGCSAGGGTVAFTVN